jgi:Recombination endonuclease VII
MKYPNKYFKDKQCPTCYTTYTPEAPSQKYCSSSCKGKNAYYTRNYGITEQEYEAMKERQNYKCAICGSDGFLIGKNNHSESLVVDHDHKTGKVRDLLCHNCNRGLGLFQDNPELLRTAYNYLKDHSKD